MTVIGVQAVDAVIRTIRRDLVRLLKVEPCTAYAHVRSRPALPRVLDGEGGAGILIVQARQLPGSKFVEILTVAAFAVDQMAGRAT